MSCLKTSPKLTIGDIIGIIFMFAFFGFMIYAGFQFCDAMDNNRPFDSPLMEFIFRGK